MVNRKRLVLGIVALVIIIVGYNLFAAYMEEKKEERREELIQIAQNAVIGEGVTLQQGVRALFLTSPNWYVVNRDEGVLLMTADSGDHFFSVYLQVNDTTQRVIFGEGHFKSDSDEYDLDSAGVDIMIKYMIQAAKG